MEHPPHRAAADAVEFDFRQQELRIPGWVRGRWPVFLQASAYIAACVASYAVGYAATRNAFLAYATLVLVYFASVIAHEIGHWIGALLAGRRVIAAQLSWIAVLRLRRGWRVRLSRP